MCAYALSSSFSNSDVALDVHYTVFRLIRLYPLIKIGAVEGKHAVTKFVRWDFVLSFSCRMIPW